MKRSRSYLRIACIGAAAMMTAVACGSSGGAKQSALKPTGANPTASAPGVSPSTITVGLIASQSGPASSTFGDAAQGAAARIDLQNAQGGVDGRKLQMDVADDQSSVTGDATAAADLVQTKNVFGVMSDSAILIGGANFLLQKGIPVVEYVSITGDLPKYTDEFTWVPGQLPAPASTLVGNVFKQVGVSRIAVLDYSDPQDQAGFATTKRGIQATGLSVCYANDSLPIGTVDFTSVVLQMKQSNCQGVYFPAVENSDIALATAIQQAGLNIKQVYATGYDQNLLDQPSARAAAQGQYFTAILPLDLPTAAVKTFYANVEKYDKAYKGGIASFGTWSGWLLADLMIKGLQVAGTNPTRASFMSNLARVTDYTGGGLFPAVSFADRWKVTNPQCAYYVQLKGTQFVPFPPNYKPICGTLVTP